MRAFLLALGFSALAAPAVAATITSSNFTKSAYQSALGGFGSAVVETFESFSEGNVANGFATAVGSFSTIGGTGSGGTVSGADFANDGNLLALRDGNVYGRTSTTRHLTGKAADDMFLDSNDTYGIRWDVSLGGSMFNRLLFTLTDAADTGARLVITVGGSDIVLIGLGSGKSKLIEIDLGGAFSSATVLLTTKNGNLSKLVKNDGFSIDDVAVSAVPLPASALLLLGGIGGLAAVRRRRKAA